MIDPESLLILVGPSFTYRMHVAEIYDGDTWTIDIDLGFGIWMKGQKIRLYGINTPEVRGVERPEGLMVRDWCRENFLGKDGIVQTFKDSKGKYGRWLGDLWIDNRSINRELVSLGYAKLADY